MCKGKIPIIVETHNAVKTSARTEIIFENNSESIELLHTEGGMTHKRHYYLVPEGTIVKCVRVSNRGNIRIKKFVIDKPLYISFMCECRELTSDELEKFRYLAGRDCECE